MKRGTQEPIDHLDQRGSPDHGVELGDDERVEGGTRVATQPFGPRQPAVAFSLMVALLLRPCLVDEVIMVPSQHEAISGMRWHHGTAFSLHGFGVFARDEDVIERRAHGLKRGAHGGTIERFDHVAKEQELRADLGLGA